MAAPAPRLDDARQCPWCERWALKNAACNWVTCGLSTRGFVAGAGCGRQWCFACGGRLCGALYDPATGARRAGVATHHTKTCCEAEPGYKAAEYCPGGHNSHCPPRSSA